MNSNNISSIKDIFSNKIEKAQYLKKIIRNLVEKGDFVNAEAKIAEYKVLFPEDIEIISIETVMLMIKGEMDRAEQHVLDGLNKVPFNFDLNYNLGFICQEKGKYQEAANALSLIHI